MVVVDDDNEYGMVMIIVVREVNGGTMIMTIW
jgi:hypothetical protein